MANGEPWDYYLRKYLLLLATVVATVTYAAGFNPPGGVWQDTDAAAGHIAGDPIILDTNYLRYAVFFYCNAAAFASSVVVVVLILLLAVLNEKKDFWIRMMPLRVVMVLDLLSLMVAYAAGTCRDKLTVVYSSLLVVAVVVYLICQLLLALSPAEEQHENGESSDVLQEERRRRKVLMLLATFAVSVTYAAGLSMPGGFWDHTDEEGHIAGDVILKEHHEARLKAFFFCNTTAFVASLLTIVLLLDRKLRERMLKSLLYGCVTVALIGLVGAYAAGSTRETRTTAYVLCLVVAVLLCMAFLVIFISHCWNPRIADLLANNGREKEPSIKEDAADKARSLVLLLATLAATITYQAGLDPPGGLWQDNGDGHTAGDPILLTTNPRRYKVFFYCNSVAFVASLVAIVLIQNKHLLRHHVLETAMILDLFGLMGAYAAGACRDVSSSIYVMALAGAVLVYVVIHVLFFTLDSGSGTGREDDRLVEKRQKRLLLFAILAATITYQVGLTPPGGFLPRDGPGYHAGEPVLLHNFPRRYMAFFYCNSVSFMLSIALIMLLVNPNLYRPAIRSYALSVCTAAGLFALMGAYAAGSTQHRTTSISIVVLGLVVSLSLVLLLLLFGGRPRLGQKEDNEETRKKDQAKRKHAKRKYLMTLGILVASVTYQAGLDPPGGVWQSTADGHRAGNPVMQDNRRRRYNAFFYSNSTSLVASIVVIILLLLPKRQQEWFRVMTMVIVLDLLALLGAYATGSSRDRKTSWNVAALVIAVLGYFVTHLTVSFRCSQQQGNGESSTVTSGC